MSTHNIQFHDKKMIKKSSFSICFLELSDEFRWDLNAVRITQGKRVIGVRGFTVHIICIP